MRIAVDAMGGDHAPLVNVDGAIAAAREFGIGSLLVGKTGRARAAARGSPVIGLRHRDRGGPRGRDHGRPGDGGDPQEAQLLHPDRGQLRARRAGRRARLGRPHRRGHGLRKDGRRDDRRRRPPGPRDGPAQPDRPLPPARRRGEPGHQDPPLQGVRGHGLGLRRARLRQEEPLDRPDVHRRGGLEGNRADEGSLQDAQRGRPQLHRQRRRARRLQRHRRRDRDGRLHRKRDPEGLGVALRDGREAPAGGDQADPPGLRRVPPLARAPSGGSSSGSTTRSMAARRFSG